MTDLFGENTPLAIGIGGGIGAIIVLVLLVVIFSKKPGERVSPAEDVASEGKAEELRSAKTKPAEPRTAAPPSESKREIIANLRNAASDSWIHPTGRPEIGTIASGVYRLGATEAARSKVFLQAKPGALYRVYFSALAVSEPTNGARNNFFVGPMFLDGEGKIVGWFVEQPVIGIADGERSGFVDAPAPSSAVTVHISIQSNHAENGPRGDGTIGFSKLRLIEV